MIRTSKDVMLVQDYKAESDDPKENFEALEKWAAELCRSLEEVVSKVYSDFKYGSSTHRVVSTLPTTDDVDEGELVIYESGVTRRLYTKVNGSLRYMSLT